MGVSSLKFDCPGTTTLLVRDVGVVFRAEDGATRKYAEEITMGNIRKYVRAHLGGL